MNADAKIELAQTKLEEEAIKKMQGGDTHKKG